MTDQGPRGHGRPLAIVCRLLVEPAAEGRVVGHVEDVDTGENVAVTGVDDLLALIVRLAGPTGR